LGWWAVRFDIWHAETWLSSDFTSANESWQIYSADQDQFKQRMFKGNQQIVNSSDGNVYPPNGLTLGSWAGHSEWSTCEVAELIVYNRLLDDQERLMVLNYIKYKYMIGDNL
jgi:hypothetical protein